MKQIIKIIIKKINELENEVNEMEQDILNQDGEIEIDELIIVDNKLYLYKDFIESGLPNSYIEQYRILDKDIKNYDLSEVNEYLIISDENIKELKNFDNIFI